MSGDTQQDGGFGPIELSAAVRAIRRELAAAAADGEGEPVRFEVGPIQLDLTVGLTRETGGLARRPARRRRRQARPRPALQQLIVFGRRCRASTRRARCRS